MRIFLNTSYNKYANTFQGSPLNRVSFLRADHTFLSQAFRHPSTTFLLFQNQEPLLKSSSELALVKYADVQPVTGEDPFSRTEEDTIAQYNSSVYLPQIVFLGLDEKKEGLVYKEHYKGQPWFAVDVTPKESVKEAAEKLIERKKSEGLEFSKGRMNMNLPAQSGKLTLKPLHAHILNDLQPPSTPKPATSSTGTPATPSAPPAATKRSPPTPASNAPVPPKTSPQPSPTTATALPAPPEPASRTSASHAPTPQSSWP